MSKTHNFIDMKGKKFDRIRVLEQYPEKSKDQRVQWVCQCDCGNIVIVTGKSLRSGNTRSCGCRQRDSVRKRNYKHGDAARGHRHRLHGILYDMIRRCHDPKCSGYEDYGSRGIYVCDEWRTPDFVTGYNAFKKWAYENGYYDQPDGTPKAQMISIDRIENDGPYAPWNCRWANKYTQSNNRGKFNQHIRVDDVVYTFGEAERHFGIPKSAIIHAYTNHWTTDQIVNRLKHADKGYTKCADGFIRDRDGFIHLTPKTDQSGVWNKYHGNEV